MIRKFNNFSTLKLLLEMSLFLWVEYIFLYYRNHSFNYSRNLTFGVIFLIWFILSIFSSRFTKFDYSKNYWNAISSNLRFYLIFLLVIIITSYFDYLIEINCNKIILSSIVYIFWSLVLETYIYASNKPKKSDEVNYKLIKATTYPELKQINRNAIKDYFFNNKDGVNTNSSNEFLELLKKQYLKESPQLYDFIYEHIRLDNYLIKETKIIRSADIYNVKTIDDASISFFINLHEINDLRRINEYLIFINKKLRHNGVYIGKFQPIRFRYKRFIEKYPMFLADVFYFFDFLWKRVAPKLPIIQKFYFAVTKGRDRALSLAEGLGRLYFTGFEVVSIREIDNFIYFIAAKAKSPSTDTNPSYGPLFKMKRIGENGEIMYVYKLRTMHPYSEYLQEYMIENFGYNKVGKPKNDFRVTAWGKIVRKLWLDELPQLINVLKGEMKLVGVRPLSSFRFNELPVEVREKRIKYKPGCIPPYVSLNMPDAKKNIEAEIIYMKEKENSRIITDIKYFFLAVYNILTNKIRSG